MTEFIAHSRRKAQLKEPLGRARKRIAAAAAAILCALPASGWLWGFTVDDALISARVASHVARGLGQRFNIGGPVVDAVTPLGYAQLLSLFGHADVLAIFQASKWLGLAAWCCAAGVLGTLIDGAGQRTRRFSPLVLVLASTPLGAWAVSGMETGLVTLFATLGLLGGAFGALCLGFAAGWRPELIPFALVLVAGHALERRARLGRGLCLCAICALPILATALVRGIFFGRAVPLSFYAKPSDFGHGLRYALGALVFTGIPWLLLVSPRAAAHGSRRVRPLLAACAAHGFALVLCGGDWMPFYRLAVPVLPCVALAGAYLAERAALIPNALRLGLGLGSASILAWGLGAPARRVGAERAALIAEARPALAHDQRVLALDIGWLGAACDAEIIDLAGVTDAEVALLPGGHTSKRIPRAWLSAHRPTAIVLLTVRGAPVSSDLSRVAFQRNVEGRVREMVTSTYRLRRTLRLGDQLYVVLEPKLGT